MKPQARNQRTKAGAGENTQGVSTCEKVVGRLDFAYGCGSHNEKPKGDGG